MDSNSQELPRRSKNPSQLKLPQLGFPKTEISLTPCVTPNGEVTFDFNDPNGIKDQLPNTYKDRQQRLVAALLGRFSNLVLLACTPVADDATLEVAASQAFEMEVESNALVQAAEDLLKLTRELKELWLAGPLREIGEGENDGKMAEDSNKVGEMVEEILKKASELNEGKGKGKA